MGQKPFKWKILPFAGTVMKNLFSDPATIKYPFEPAKFPERMRGHIVIRIDECISCGLCERNCPPRAIKVDRAAGTWAINRFDCIQCGNCTNVCPKKCLEIVPGYTEPGTEKITETFTRPVTEKTAANGPKVPEGAAGAGSGKLINNASECVFCGLCARKCPQQAIIVDRASKTWTVDHDECVKCGLCVNSCPKKCLNFQE